MRLSWEFMYFSKADFLSSKTGRVNISGWNFPDKKYKSQRSYGFASFVLCFLERVRDVWDVGVNVKARKSSFFSFVICSISFSLVSSSRGIFTSRSADCRNVASG